ncbi:putative ATPase [Pyrococcus sp. ST04]|nr:putative ATPase [Pyrococcus sp. ST04]
MRALERVKAFISHEAYIGLRNLLEMRLYGKPFERKNISSKVAVAYSGGSDSTATLEILRWAGFDAIPVTAKLPQMSEDTIKKIKEKGAILVDVPGYLEEMERLMNKRAPICGRCHSMVMSAVEKKAKEIGAEILASGDMLSVGSGSIYYNGNIVILNLPAFLALNKKILLEILGWKDYKLSYGCPLWREAVKRAPIMKRFAIQRVLRELRAGALTKDMARELIIDILKA